MKPLVKLHLTSPHYEKSIAVWKAVAASPKDAEASSHPLPTFDASCPCSLPMARVNTSLRVLREPPSFCLRERPIPALPPLVLALKHFKTQGPMAVVFQCGATVLDHAAAYVACVEKIHH